MVQCVRVQMKRVYSLQSGLFYRLCCDSPYLFEVFKTKLQLHTHLQPCINNYQPFITLYKHSNACNSHTSGLAAQKSPSDTNHDTCACMDLCEHKYMQKGLIVLEEKSLNLKTYKQDILVYCLRNSIKECFSTEQHFNRGR